VWDRARRVVDQTAVAETEGHAIETAALIGDRGGAAATYDFSEQIGHLLRRAYQTHLAIFQRNACDPQLTSVQFVTLCALRDHGPRSQADLVKITKIDQATIRGILDRLKARGLIALASDRRDRRKIIMSLTETGARLLEAMVPRAVEITELTMARLNPAERAAALFVLRKMIEPDDA
jgi:DNA-binding MarR family transcriptional regulator